MRADRHDLRLKLIAYARKHGIKAAVREFGCSVHTVRKWLRRGHAQSQSTKPKHCPHQTPEAVERLVVRRRKQSGFGAERLKVEFDLPCGVNAIARILRQKGLTQRRRKKYQIKRILVEEKQQWKPFTQICMDTMYLTDLPHYWSQMNRLKLPRFQYTAREVVTGITYVGYADELSKTYACLMADRVCQHLKHCGLSMSTLLWQTDNGSEYGQASQTNDWGFPETVQDWQCQHRYIPPRRYTYQADVETIHGPCNVVSVN